MEEKILELLQQLQNAIMSIAPQAWGLLVKKQFVSGIIELVLIVMFIIIAIILFVKLQKVKEELKSEDPVYNREEIFATYLGQTALSIVVFITVVAGIENILLKIFMPEYMAIIQLIDWIK